MRPSRTSAVKICTSARTNARVVSQAFTYRVPENPGRASESPVAVCRRPYGLAAP
jgi:hypothetical protein